MPDFSRRSVMPEKMDEPGVSAAEVHQALRELEIINRLLGGYNVILNGLDKVCRTFVLRNAMVSLSNHGSPNEITILDLGSGGGDMLRRISKWAHQRKKKANLMGVDWNPVMTQFATEKAKDYNNIRFITANVFDDNLLNEKADIVMNSLFCHHFDNAELVELISRMNELASKAVIINDLHRNWFAYYAIKVITRIFSKTFLVRYDGPLSVARSLKRKEWESILHQAGITNYKLRWMWAWRWQIIWDRPGIA